MEYKKITNVSKNEIDTEILKEIHTERYIYIS